MLREIIEYLCTPCPWQVRRLGYLKESIAISARARRLQNAWKPHLDNCQQFIESSAALCSGNEVVWVLGAGSLLDIPIKALCRKFKQVYLIDCVHSLKVRWCAMMNPQIHRVHFDLSGVIEGIVRVEKGGARASLNELPSVAIAEPQLPVPDFIVSANLFAQLPLIPKAYYEQKGIGEKKLDAWCESILLAHFQWLNQYRAPLCLITETCRDYEYDCGRKTEKIRALPKSLHLPKANAQWTWDIAPKGEINADTSVRFKVSAFHFLQR